MHRLTLSSIALATCLLGCAVAPARAEPSLGEPWSYAASASFYLIEGESDYAQPTITADRGRLHLEARFNYEDLDTGSAWVGYNLTVGEKLVLEVTPMLGVVFGETTGIAPGYKGTLSGWGLDLYSEVEYVIDADDSDDSFLYTWTELTVAPADGWRAGLVIQRTKAYETEFEIQRGLLVGYSFERLEMTAYAFNPDDSSTWVLAVGGSF
jgi:hypothetical protein